MAQAIDTIEVSSDVRNHRGVARRRRPGDKPQTGKSKKEPIQNEVIVPTPELTEEEALLPDLSGERASDMVGETESATPARDAMRRRRAAVDVPTDETLRVVPVDQRPEFIAQGKVDDSQTRVFGGLAMELSDVQAQSEEKPEVMEAAPAADMEIGMEEADAAGSSEGDTIRLDRAQIDEINQGTQRRDAFRKGKKRGEIKPMKKGFGLFGKKKPKKQENEDDFIEDFEEDFIDD